MSSGMPAPDAEFFYALLGAVVVICGAVLVILKIWQIIRPQPGAQELALRVKQVEERLARIEENDREDRNTASSQLAEISGTLGAMRSSIDALRENLTNSVNAQARQSKSEITDLRARIGRVEKQLSQRGICHAPAPLTASFPLPKAADDFEP